MWMDFRAWYLAFSIYGMLKKVGNIGHDAHMGGAIVGIVVAVIYTPAKLLSMNAVYLGIMSRTR